MGKKTFLIAAMAALFLAVLLVSGTGAVSDYDGQIVKMEGLNTLYYVIDDKRYIFPNEKTYLTWFPDYEGVIVLQPSQIAALPLAGNVRYRPGVLMVKITTDPKVYAVARNGVLRWIKTEQIARKLYGQNWNLLIDDIPDSFFTNYTIGDPVDNDLEYDPEGEVGDTASINANRGLALGHAKQAQTAKCRAVPAVPAEPNRKGEPTTPATPAIPARECKVNGGDGGDDDETDITVPTISDLAATAATTTAKISWETDELATGQIKYALESLSTATTSDITSLSSAATTTAHLFNLTGLAASSTYYYKVWSTDLSANTASSSETTFKTLAE